MSIFNAQEPELSNGHYRIYSVASQREITIEELINESAQTDVIFFGELHNDSVAHYLELEITKALFGRHGSNFAVAMEMFDRDVQPVMNEYLRGSIRERHFNKDARIWSNYGDYKPVVEFAKENNIPVVCSNAASRYTNLAGREGQGALKDLPVLSKKNFAPMPYDTASGAYHAKLMALMEVAPTHTPPPAPGTETPAQDSVVVVAPIFNPMMSFSLVTAQSLWDATMAYSIAEYRKANKKDKVLHINGSFHSDEHFGIVIQLKKYSPKTKIMVISCSPDNSFPSINWSEHSSRGDFIIITDPAVPRTFED
ncbi:MAG: ChaN family lipoprotein [Flavobacteriales bacterium]|nr:ChaN family lipoprotein [Flavobacteriales bacterium]